MNRISWAAATSIACGGVVGGGVALYRLMEISNARTELQFVHGTIDRFQRAAIAAKGRYGNSFAEIDLEIHGQFPGKRSFGTNGTVFFSGLSQRYTYRLGSDLLSPTVESPVDPAVLDDKLCGDATGYCVTAAKPFPTGLDLWVFDADGRRNVRQPRIWVGVPTVICIVFGILFALLGSLARR